jgi:hypothetical protein
VIASNNINSVVNSDETTVIHPLENGHNGDDASGPAVGKEIAADENVVVIRADVDDLIINAVVDINQQQDEDPAVDASIPRREFTLARALSFLQSCVIVYLLKLKGRSVGKLIPESDPLGICVAVIGSFLAAR